MEALASVKCQLAIGHVDGLSATVRERTAPWQRKSTRCLFQVR